MGKKKSRGKTNKAEVAFPSDDPTPESKELVPALPEDPPTSSEEATTVSSKDDSNQPIAAPAESTIEDPAVEAPAIESTSEDLAAEDATIVKQEEETKVPVVEIVEAVPNPEPAIEHDVTEEPAQIAAISQETSDTESALEHSAPSDPSLLDQDPSPEHHISAPVATEQPETTEAPIEPAEVEPSTVEEIILEAVKAAPEPQSEPAEEVEEPIAVPEHQLESLEYLEESEEESEPEESVLGPEVDSWEAYEESIAAPEPEAEAEEIPESEPEVEDEEIAELEILTVSEPQAEAKEIPEPEPESEAEEIAEPEILTASEPQAETEKIPEPEPEPEAEEEVVAEPEILTVPEPQAEAKDIPEPEPQVEDKGVPELEPQAEAEEIPELEPEVEAEDIAEPEILTVSKPQAEAEEIPEPEPEAEAEKIPEPEPEAEAKEIPEPEPEAEAESIPEPEILAVPKAQPEAERFAGSEHKSESPATSRATSPTRSTFSSNATTVELKPEPMREPIHAPSPKRSLPHLALEADEPSAPSPPPVERKPVPEYRERRAEPTSPPRPLTIARAIEDDRPPAPTPPVGRYRPRNSIAFDSDDSDDSSIIQPRLRGDRPDPARAPSYPPQSSHPRSLFASRVPPEHYSPPPPQAPPPGYHPRYYPPPTPHYPPVAPQYQHGSPHPYNNNMSQIGGYPQPGQYRPPSHGSSSYQESWGQLMPTYPPYGSPQRQDSIGSREYPMGPPSLENGSSTMEDDTGDVFSRIAQAIPDLHVLLAKYKETHGQFTIREDALRRAGIEQQEKLKMKDEELYHMREKMNHMEFKHSSDANRLRLEIGNMEEQMKELREQAAQTEKFKKEAEKTRLELDAAKASWETQCKDLEDANALLEKTALEEKANAQKDFDNWRSTTNIRHDAEKIALSIQFEKKLKDADVLADQRRQEAAASFVKEKDELRSDHQRQQRERESDYDRVRKELETKLSTAQKDREDSLIHERESREVWEEERDSLSRAYDEDRESLQRGWDEQREFLDGQYRKNKEESDKAWGELHADAKRKAEEEKAKVERLTKEKDLLQREYNMLRAESRREKEVIKSVAGNLESERARLEKLMECYGDIAEIKSKGDTYYSVSFSQLQNQIVDLATTHFVHLPVSPPPDDLAQIPSGLPSFLGDTMASRQLRAAYITHTVAKMITYRVFGPFLFSLGRRYDKADTLFSSMSSHIRDKSTRKEAIWRQQTLLAAFTSSGAKQRINTAAGTVVDEIIVAIKNFADPKEEEGIRIAVKRIVKLAAETWRFARLEREMITATMPALQDEEHNFTGLEYWPAVRPEGTAMPSPSRNAGSPDESTKILLRLFPVIYREPPHENFQPDDQESADVGCIYHHGLALYDDAEPVVKRSEELKHAGLPPVANSPPTAADFPPPMIPPPRNALPQTPGVLGNVIAPSAPTEYSRHLPPMSDLSIPPYKRRSDKASIKSTMAPAPPIKRSSMKRTTLPPMSDLSIPPFIPKSERPSIKPKKPLPSAMKRHAPPAMSDLSIPPYVPRSERGSNISAMPPQSQRASVVSEMPPPESLPSPNTQFEYPDSPALTMFDLAARPYARNIYGQGNSSNFKLAASTNVSSRPLTNVSSRPLTSASSRFPMESSYVAGTYSSRQYQDPSRPAPAESVHPKAPSRPSNVPPLPAPTDPSTLSSRPYTRDFPRPPIPMTMDLSHMDDETAIIRPLFSRRNSPIASPMKDNTPTPSAPGSRAVSPPSPLYVAEDEIDSLATYRNRNPGAGTSRRSTPGRTSNEELRKDTMRRTSGYAISNRSSIEGSVRTERTNRSSMSSNSRYMCEHKSAAIKGLYPNSPMVGTQEINRTNSLRSSGRRSVADKTESALGAGVSGAGVSGAGVSGTGVSGTGVSGHGTWDTSTVSGLRTQDGGAGTEAAWDALTANGKEAKEKSANP